MGDVEENILGSTDSRAGPQEKANGVLEAEAPPNDLQTSLVLSSRDQT